MKEYLTNAKAFFREKKDMQKDINLFVPSYKDLYIFLGIMLGGVFILLFYACFIGGAGVRDEPLSDRILFFTTAMVLASILLFLLLIVTHGEHIVIYNNIVIKRTHIIYEQRMQLSEITNCKIVSGRGDLGEGPLNLKIKSKKQLININIFPYSYESTKRMCILLGYNDLVK